MTPEERARHVVCEWQRKYPHADYLTLIAEALAQARAEAIEEAAIVCEVRSKFIGGTSLDPHGSGESECDFLAAAIRSLPGAQG